MQLLTTDSTSPFSFSAYTIITGRGKGIIKQPKLNTFSLVKKRACIVQGGKAVLELVRCTYKTNYLAEETPAAAPI